MYTLLGIINCFLRHKDILVRTLTKRSILIQKTIIVQYERSDKRLKKTADKQVSEASKESADSYMITINESVNQSVNQSINQLINQSKYLMYAQKLTG